MPGSTSVKAVFQSFMYRVLSLPLGFSRETHEPQHSVMTWGLESSGGDKHINSPSWCGQGCDGGTPQTWGSQRRYLILWGE